MKKTLSLALLAATMMTTSSHAQEAGRFDKKDMGDFTVHTYASNDPMHDSTVIVEGKKSLVIIEPQAFKPNVEEFAAYTKSLKKPIARVIASYHALGMTPYRESRRVIPKSMNAFMNTKGKGMIGFFAKKFPQMDTTYVKFDTVVADDKKFTVDGVKYSFEPSKTQGMPGVNIGIGGKVFYQHFAPSSAMHVSQHMIQDLTSFDGPIADAEAAKKAGYTWFVASHGPPADVQTLDAWIHYMKTLRKIAKSAKSKEEFLTRVKRSYPKLKGEDGLAQIAAKLYKPTT